jgi:hypothetical protein
MELRYVDVARFPAIGTVVFSIHAKANIMLSLAIAAIAVAHALVFRQIALHAQDHGLHVLPSSFRRK